MIMIDMKIPKCCIGCPILRDYYGWEAYCPFVHENHLKERTDRPSECPLKEIEESELISSEKSNSQDQIQKTDRDRKGGIKMYKQLAELKVNTFVDYYDKVVEALEKAGFTLVIESETTSTKYIIVADEVTDDGTSKDRTDHS